jgi:hypothetical protein
MAEAYQPVSADLGAVLYEMLSKPKAFEKTTSVGLSLPAMKISLASA